MNQTCQRAEKPRTIEKTVCCIGSFLRRVGVLANVFFHASAIP
jgi:hypothetical protein